MRPDRLRARRAAATPTLAARPLTNAVAAAGGAFEWRLVRLV
jgi:hypothetical protein